MLYHLFRGDISFGTFQGYLFAVSILVLCLADGLQIQEFDVAVMRQVDIKEGWSKTYCATQYKEKNYHGPVKVMMVSHFIGLILAYWSRFSIVAKYNYDRVRREGKELEYK